jgi:hypothetical protein
VGDDVVWRIRYKEVGGWMDGEDAVCLLRHGRTVHCTVTPFY